MKLCSSNNVFIGLIGNVVIIINDIMLEFFLVMFKQLLIVVLVLFI